MGKVSRCVKNLTKSNSREKPVHFVLGGSLKTSKRRRREIREEAREEDGKIVEYFGLGAKKDCETGFRAKTMQVSMRTAALKCFQEETVDQSENNFREDRFVPQKKFSVGRTSYSLISRLCSTTKIIGIATFHQRNILEILRAPIN